MTDTETHQRVCANIPYPLYLKFKHFASQTYSFKKGYTQKAVNHSIEIWVWMMSMDNDILNALNEIGEKEYCNIKNQRERHKKMMMDAVLEFIENHKD